MLKNPKLLLVGGNSRFVGKTTLIKHIIETHSPSRQIVSLKLTSIYADDLGSHGKHEPLLNQDFEILEETNTTGNKDTALMLRAGAVQSFYIQCSDHAIMQAWQAFEQYIKPSHYLVCESRSLRRFLEPGFFIYLKSTKVAKEKPYADWLEERANLILTDPDPSSLTQIARNLTLDENGWGISNEFAP